MEAVKKQNTTAGLTDGLADGIFDLLPVGAIVVDRDLKIRVWNRTVAEWSNIPVEKAVGNYLTTLFPNLSEPSYRTRLDDVFNSSMPVKFSAAFHRHFLPVPSKYDSGSEFMVQQTEVRPIPNSPGRALITIQDVSLQYDQLARLKAEHQNLVKTRDALTEANRTLTQRNQDLNEFSYVASHDLQEPLRKITTFCELLQQTVSPEEVSSESTQFLGYIHSAANRMKSLISDILTLSRTGTEKLVRKSVHLSEVVANVLSDLDLLIHEKGARISIGQLPRVNVDTRLISQLMQNLISNALKFTGEAQPLIEINAKPVLSSWVVSVADNGIGLEKEYATQIFKPFQRLHARNVYNGTGIGLAICKKAVARHGGDIWVESEKGKGATFYFTVPYVPVPNE